MKPTAKIIKVDSSLKLNELSITMEINVPIYVWSDIDRYGFTIKEDDPYDTLLGGVLMPSMLSPTSAGSLSYALNQVIKDLVSFYGRYTDIPKATLISVLPAGWMRTKTKVFSVYDIYLVYNHNKNSIFEEWDCVLKLIESDPYLKSIIDGDMHDIKDRYTNIK